MFDIFLATAVTLVAVLAVWWGFVLGRSSLLWVVLPLALLLVQVIALNGEGLAFVPPLSWFASGSGRWIGLVGSASVTFGVLASRVKTPGQRRALLMLSGVVILRAGTLPFLGPALCRAEEEALQTQTDGKGVCLQGTSYNCGPAAAVTALRALGFSAEEGALALLMKTDPISGTPDDTMATALKKRYGPEGLVLERSYLHSVDALRAWPVAIAVIRFSLYVDHYVAVLGFEGDDIIIGDPLQGRQVLPVADFKAKWRNVALLLRRER